MTISKMYGTAVEKNRRMNWIFRKVMQIYVHGKNRRKGTKMNGVYAYFAYGSNLLPERLFQRCPTAVAYAPAILPNIRA